VSFAQDEGITLLRDAEIETYLRKISTPIFVAAGIDPDAVTIYLVGNEEMNAFVSGGQNLFVFSGLIAAAERPNETGRRARPRNRPYGRRPFCCVLPTRGPARCCQ